MNVTMPISLGLCFAMTVVSLATDEPSNGQTNPTLPDDAPYQVVGTVPQPKETGFARDQTILFYLDRPLPANQVISPSFVIYKSTGLPATGTATILPGRKAIAFVPSPVLKAGPFDTPDYNYEMNISYASSGLHVVPYSSPFSTVALFDQAGIWAQQASPEGDAVNVSTDYHPFLMMNEPLDPATVKDSNVVMTDAAKNVVATTVSFDYSNNVLRIVPATLLQPNTVYIITLSTTGVKSMAGQSFLYPYVWQFTTRPAATPPDSNSPNPYVLQVQPAAYSSEVAVDSAITVTFSAAIDPTTLTSQTVHLRTNYAPPTEIAARLNYSAVTNSLTIQPTNPLPGSTPMNVILDAANILSAGDNPLPLQSNVETEIPFQTQATPGVVGPTPPTLPPGGKKPTSF
jgi:hypothetical protein